MSPPPLRVLISGAGIGGPVAAYWLAKVGQEVTVVERAAVLRKEGHTVDIRKEGLRIVEWMGIRGKIDKQTTKEAGMQLVDDKGKVWAAFPQSGDTSFTSEVEIVRGVLSTLLYETSKSNVNYLFGTTIDDFTETDEGVIVTLKNRSSGETQQKTFDVIIAAEGLYSRTRAKAFNEDISMPIHSLNLFSAAFSVPANETDTLWADMTTYTKKRATLTRPDGFGRTCVSLSWIDEGPEVRAMAHPRTPTETQKEYVKSRFQDLRSPIMRRLLDGLAASDDLYLSEIGQTKTPSWSRGRVVLLGDTAYCPSAYTGMGTTTTIAGAYVLAAELVRNPRDHKKAFAAYEDHLRPWIEKIQQLPPGVTTRPESQMGVTLLYWLYYGISIVVKLGVISIISKLFPSADQTLPLPPVTTFDCSNLCPN